MSAAVILSYDVFRDTNPAGVVAPQYNAPMYLRNRMINVDQILPELRAYKHITAIYPTAEMNPNSNPLQIAWGAYDYVNAPVTLGPYLNYTADGLNYKLDYIADGRYLDLRVYFDDDVYDVKFSALDMDFTVSGKR